MAYITRTGLVIETGGQTQVHTLSPEQLEMLEILASGGLLASMTLLPERLTFWNSTHFYPATIYFKETLNVWTDNKTWLAVQKKGSSLSLWAERETFIKDGYIWQRAFHPSYEGAFVVALSPVESEVTWLEVTPSESYTMPDNAPDEVVIVDCGAGSVVIPKAHVPSVLAVIEHFQQEVTRYLNNP